MSFPRRSPTRILLDILNCIEEKGGAGRWDLIKILGSEQQFRHWKTKLLDDKIIVEQKEKNRYIYKKAKNGELLHKTLKNDAIVKLLLPFSGKRLRR